MYVSEKTEGEIGKDDRGSFDSVVAIDCSKADRSRSETSTFFPVRKRFPESQAGYLVVTIDSFLLLGAWLEVHPEVEGSLLLNFLVWFR